jgi:osmotically-inducible protein OsmY
MAALSDMEIKANVEAELRCCPNIDESRIAVRVNGGTVTLSGFVRNLFHKYGAEDAVSRVAGVAAISNDIRVWADKH